MALTKNVRSAEKQPEIKVDGVPSTAFKAEVIYSCGCGYTTYNIDNAVKHCFQEKHSMIVQGYVKSLHRKEEKKVRSQRYAAPQKKAPNRDSITPEEQERLINTYRDNISRSFDSLRTRLSKRSNS